MYGNFNPNPYGVGNYNAVQSRLDSYPQYSRPQMANVGVALSGRIVTGMEEARASQIPLDGSVSYFPSPAENKIYAKGIDMNGLPVFLTYELKMPSNPNSDNIVTSQFSAIENRLTVLENKMKEMLKHDESNANVSNAQ